MRNPANDGAELRALNARLSKAAQRKPFHHGRGTILVAGLAASAPLIGALRCRGLSVEVSTSENGVAVAHSGRVEAVVLVADDESSAMTSLRRVRARSDAPIGVVVLCPESAAEVPLLLAGADAFLPADVCGDRLYAHILTVLRRLRADMAPPISLEGLIPTLVAIGSA